MGKTLSILLECCSFLYRENTTNCILLAKEKLHSENGAEHLSIWQWNYHNLDTAKLMGCSSQYPKNSQRMQVRCKGYRRFRVNRLPCRVAKQFFFGFGALERLWDLAGTESRVSKALLLLGGCSKYKAYLWRPNYKITNWYPVCLKLN